MFIKKHYHVEEVLQRSVVMDGHVISRRIVRWVNPDGSLASEIPTAPIWQERQWSGEYHNIPADSAALNERRFIEALIRDNGLDRP